MESVNNKNDKIIALYLRLSREDGDKVESDSISNQRLKLDEYISSSEELSAYDVKYYIDDGYSGTNFNREGFQEMKDDIEAGLIYAVVVKDLSRLGRQNAKMSEILYDFFPTFRVRFIAVDDNIDREYYDVDGSDDMKLDVMNWVNSFYPKDISKKVRSSFRAKQHSGKFIGAFACYGYKKDLADHNKLIIDEPAAEVVRKIFRWYLSGKGQRTIAILLNKEKIPCPSEYKKRNGMNYHNSNKLDSTTYWTYSSVRRILTNRMYVGDMVQNKSFRSVCKKKAKKLPEKHWIIVENTHEAIIDRDTFDKVAKLLANNTREMKLNKNIHIFASLLKCNDCGRAMVKLTRNGKYTYYCGSYNRYGTSHCSSHNIDYEVIEKVIKDDLNAILDKVNNLQEVVDEEQDRKDARECKKKYELERIENEIVKLEIKKKRAYNDYLDDIISKTEYVHFKEQLDISITEKQEHIKRIAYENDIKRNEWISRLLKIGHIDVLDRSTVVEMVNMIYVTNDNELIIVYNFSDELEDIINAS